MSKKREIAAALKRAYMPIVGDSTRATMCKNAIGNGIQAAKLLNMDNTDDISLLVDCLMSIIETQTMYYVEKSIIERKDLV